MLFRLFSALFLLLPGVLVARDTTRVAEAWRISTHISVDGHLDEMAWQQARPAGNFVQYVPVYGATPSFPTEVRFLYSDYALYIGAMMYDPHPDSILKQLGDRDANNLNADYIAFGFDTYNNNLDAYLFQVYASGVQMDSREQDGTYDGVWRSAVKIHAEGWTVEIEIPYSAIRFPRQANQQWGLQIERNLRRYREKSQWAPEIKGSANPLMHWGLLNGIRRINPLPRLSFTPYISAALEHFPENVPGRRNLSYTYSGGLDLKYGINESFTFDMTLLPDFTQVKSDDKIKNLSAFETVYKEQRPFFQEAVDLFKKGDLFYSRRIGRTPAGFYNAANALDSNEVLVDNPVQARLINAFKLSGRNRHGLAVGVLNALTNREEATIEDNEGNTRTELTEPLTNYNILVFDQALRNNSSAYLINTSVLRENRHSRAFVTGAGLNLYNRRSVFGLQSAAALSQIYADVDGNGYRGQYGWKSHLTAGKFSGSHQYTATLRMVDKDFDANDMGITRTKDYFEKSFYYTYRVFEPVGRFRDMTFRFFLTHQSRLSTGKPENVSIQLNGFFNTLKYVTYWVSLGGKPAETWDYYEPRAVDRFYISPRYLYGSFNFSTDYRKVFSLDGGIDYSVDDFSGRYFSFELQPRVRVSDHLFFYYQFEPEFNKSDHGYIGKEPGGGIVFARRDIRGVENALSAIYNFRNNLSLTLWARHYWYAGDYRQFFLLGSDGRLTEYPAYTGEKGFNFNAFNIDLSFNWEFSPGSRLVLVWKNAILSDDNEVKGDLFYNLRRIFDEPQTNTFSVKWLYYIDYMMLKKTFGKVTAMPE
jgi:hypothetical protein